MNYHLVKGNSIALNHLINALYSSFIFCCYVLKRPRRNALYYDFMRKLKLTLRRLVLNLSRRDRGSATAFLLYLFPPLLAATLAKKGEISRPLRLLKLMGFGLPPAKRLKARLDDMNNTLKHCGNQDVDNELSVVPKFQRFNGVVVFTLHSCGFFDPSGYASRSIALLRALQKSNVQVNPMLRPGYPWDLAKHAGRPEVKYLSYEGFDFKLIPDARHTLHSRESDYVDYYAAELRHHCEDVGASVVHAASNYLNGLAAAKAGASLGIPSVYELRGLWHITRAFSEPEYEATEHYRYVEMQEVTACKKVTRVITLSEALANWLVEHGVRRDKISVVGNAAWKPCGINEVDARADVRQSFGIGEDELVIGYLGSLVAYEGLDELLYAVSELEKSLQPRILLIGSGKVEQTLKSLASTLGISDRVIFGGRVPSNDVSKYYYAMDMVALPRKDHLLTRLVPAIKPYEVAIHNRHLLISPALSMALGGTLDASRYDVIDFGTKGILEKVVRHGRVVHSHHAVATWDDRGRQLREIYESQLFPIQVD